MAYTHGEKWTDDKILNELTKIVQHTKQKTLPTTSEMNDFYGNFKLSNAVRRSKVSRETFAKRLGLEIKYCESVDGEKYEKKCINDLTIKLGLESQMTPKRYPYDLLVENTVKIDVKHSNGIGKAYFSCNLEKTMQTCDIFVVYCTFENGEKVYIIPSSAVSGQNQVGIGLKNSKYDKYLNRWDIILDYYKFMSKVF